MYICFSGSGISRRSRGYRVYIGGLPRDASENDIENAFADYELRSIWLAREPTGFAFVVFEDLRDAKAAVKQIDGR